MRLSLIKVITLFLLCYYAQPKLLAQQSGPNTLTIPLTENILIETDRELYMSGEQINLSYILYDPILKKKLNTSKIVYTEFFDSKNKIIEQIKTELTDCKGYSLINIPKRLPTGIYYIRTYTNFMKNFGCHNFTYTSIKVLNPFAESIQKKKNTGTPSAIQTCNIYPEGGNIINNFSNRIVCSFTNYSGSPIPVMARVVDNNNNIITTFTTNELGIGEFTFTPQPALTYKLEATSGDNVFTSPITISEKGINMTKLEQNSNEILLKINNNATKKTLKVEIHQSHKLISSQNLPIQKSEMRIPLDNIPPGIQSITLKDTNNQTLSHLYFYKAPEAGGNIQLSTNKLIYATREAANLSISGNFQDKMSLSVSIHLTYSNNINSYTRDITSKHLKSALYSFCGGKPYPINKITTDSLILDQVLICKEAPSPNPNNQLECDIDKLEYFPEIKTDLIFGNAKDSNGQPISKQTVLQTWIDTVSTMQTTKTNENGQFFFASERAGSNQLIVRPSNNISARLEISKEFYPDFFHIAEEELLIPASSDAKLKQQLINLQINDAFKTSVANNNNKNPLPFYINPDKVYFIDDYVPLLTLKDFLYEVVAGILPYTLDNKTIVKITDPKYSTTSSDNPLFLVDGIPIFNANLIANLKCTEIKSVAVVYKKYFFQHEIFDGILDIRTHKGEASVLKLPQYVSSLNFVGIQRIEQLGTNSHCTGEMTKPQFKTQLYWNPFIEIKSKDTHTIDFNTPDNTGNYIIRVNIKETNGTNRNYYSQFIVEPN